MTVAAVALGSNLGDREATLRESVRRVGSLGTVVALSRFYDTEPVGYLDQPRFLNGALLVETESSAWELLSGLLEIEIAMGRVRGVDKGPRVIDLDLLLFGDAVIDADGLIVPHPAMRERRFVLEPLAEIAGDMVNPGTKKTIAAMLAELDADA